MRFIPIALFQSSFQVNGHSLSPQRASFHQQELGLLRMLGETKTHRHLKRRKTSKTETVDLCQINKAGDSFFSHYNNKIGVKLSVVDEAGSCISFFW